MKTTKLCILGKKTKQKVTLSDGKSITAIVQTLLAAKIIIWILLKKETTCSERCCEGR